jgi:hypothetical protein
MDALSRSIERQPGRRADWNADWDWYFIVSARQFLNSGNVFQASIPIRAARDKNMGVSWGIDRGIQATSRDDQQSPIHLNPRKCRAAL